MLQLHAYKAKRDSGTASPDIDTKSITFLRNAFFVGSFKKIKKVRVS